MESSAIANKCKTVQFGINTTFVFPQTAEEKEYRLPYWEVVARDNERFKNRIESCGLQLNSVLAKEHRDQVYKARFEEQTFPKLKDFAYDQWLLGDLCEIGEGCLEPNLKEKKCVVLRQVYSLQVHTYIDCANSSYIQVKSKRGGLLEIENHPDETSTELTEWGQGPKGHGKTMKTRKLIFQLSDGKQQISGLEYKPLPCFKGRVFPGLKILITGPIECRRGMLLIEPRHLKLLGGEIESMLIPNAPENVLARRLNLTETLEPYQDGEDTVAEPGRLARQGREVARVAPSISRPNAPAVPRPLAVPVPNALVVARPRIPAAPRPTVPSAPRFTLSPVLPFSRPAATNIRPSQSQAPRSNPSMQQMSNVDDDDDFEISEEDLLQLEQESTRILESSQSQQQKKPTQQNREESYRTFDEAWEAMEAQFSAENESLAASFQTPTSSTNQLQKSASEKQTSAPQPQASTSNIDEYDLAFFDDEDIFDEVPTTQTKSVPCNKQTSCSSGASTSRYMNSASSSSTMRETNVLPYASIFKKANTNLESQNEEIESMQSDIRLINSQPIEIDSSDDETTESRPNLSGFLERTGPNAAESEPDAENPPETEEPPQVISSWPFVYLSQLNDADLNLTRVTVKANVVAILDKLKYEEEIWSLPVKINDGSATLAVNLSNEVMEQLIGFSVVECVALKIEAKENELAGIKMREGMEGFKKKLIELNCIMELDFEGDVPAVVQLTDIDESHFKELHSRQLPT